MNYKETFYFIAKCLTISLDASNREEIKKQLKSNNIDWDSVVKVSTNHQVFPALYCNLKKSNFLHYLPKKLVNYMNYITNLNRDRNKKIIKQVRKLNSILLANNITPIFLKGSANLISGIYDDIAERMIVDIDFIFSKEDYPKAIKLLQDFDYSEVKKYKYYYPGGNHYRRLQNKNYIAAIEIHSEILGYEDIGNYSKEFDYNFVEKDSQVIDDIRVLSYANKLNISIISNQINDNGYYYKMIHLRNAYDVFLLSKKTNAKDAVNRLNKLTKPLNCFLATCYEIFNKVDSLEHNTTKMTTSYLNIFDRHFTNPFLSKIRYRFINIFLFIRFRLYILFKSTVNKKYRIWLFKRLKDKNYYKEKLIKLGFKKTR